MKCPKCNNNLSDSLGGVACCNFCGYVEKQIEPIKEVCAWESKLRSFLEGLEMSNIDGLMFGIGAIGAFYILALVLRG